MRSFVAWHIGAAGAAMHLVLAHPNDGSPVLPRLTLLAKDIRSAKQTRTWRTRYQHSVGVVMGLEIEGGSTLSGHPHAHLFVFSADYEELISFLAWMKRRWRRRVGWDLVEGCQVSVLSSMAGDWAPRLRYVMKGSELDPEWPVDLLKEVIASLSAGKRLLTFWGLARREGGWLRPRPRGRARVLRLRPLAASRLRSTG
ncbi:MAG TPA: hypothetical protein V6C82_09595 [Chroococcales cyanobacterium]